MKLATKNIFLDTNIYEENNFFQSSNIQSLFHYSQIGVIELYMTTISKMELIDRMKKKLADAKDEHNKLVNSINKTRILKNLKIYENIEKSQITVGTSIIELISKLEVIMDFSHIKVIPATTVSIDDVFSLYYNKKPPFCQKSKKFEFPDAFILKSIDTWCIAKRKKMYFVTKDENFDGYKSTRLIFRKELTNLLSDITAYYDYNQKYQVSPRIIESLKRNENAILDLIDTKIDSMIKLELDYENISHLSLKKPRLYEYKISSIRPTYAEITYYVELDVSFTVFPSTLDIERTVFSDNLKPKKYSKNLIIPCDLEISLRNSNDIKLKWINSNQKLYVNIEK